MIEKIYRKNKFPLLYYTNDTVYQSLIFFSFFYTLSVCLTLPHPIQLTHSLRNISEEYDKNEKNAIESFYIGIRVAEKEQQQKKRENIYIYT